MKQIILAPYMLNPSMSKESSKPVLSSFQNSISLLIPKELSLGKDTLNLQKLIMLTLFDKDTLQISFPNKSRNLVESCLSSALSGLHLYGIHFEIGIPHRALTLDPTNLPYYPIDRIYAINQFILN